MNELMVGRGPTELETKIETIKHNRWKVNALKRPSASREPVPRRVVMIGTDFLFDSRHYASLGSKNDRSPTHHPDQ